MNVRQWLSPRSRVLSPAARTGARGRFNGAYERDGDELATNPRVSVVARARAAPYDDVQRSNHITAGAVGMAAASVLLGAWAE
jgi:hypothetical protein